LWIIRESSLRIIGWGKGMWVVRDGWGLDKDMGGGWNGSSWIIGNSIGDMDMPSEFS
jgi:hypothetical protein